MEPAEMVGRILMTGWLLLVIPLAAWWVYQSVTLFITWRQEARSTRAWHRDQNAKARQAWARRR